MADMNVCICTFKCTYMHLCLKYFFPNAEISPRDIVFFQIQQPTYAIQDVNSRLQEHTALLIFLHAYWKSERLLLNQLALSEFLHLIWDLLLRGE